MKYIQPIFMLFLSLVVACDGGYGTQVNAGQEEVEHAETAKGPNRGNMLSKEDFSIELAIFEMGVPPEFRAWATDKGASLAPDAVDLNVTLTRLGGVRDEISFTAEGDFLRGSAVVYEPHSFVVNVLAEYSGKTYQWQYDNFEGRTSIARDIADAAGISVATAGPGIIREDISVYGKVVSDPENVSHVSARFDGVIRAVGKSIGDVVEKGDTLAVVEANDSLNDYSIKAPIAGTIIERHANSGESTDGRTLFTIVDTSSVWAELAVFPSDRPRVKIGAPVTVRTAIGDISVEGKIALLSPVAGSNQSVTARVPLDNSAGLLAAGMYLTGEIEVGLYSVPIAVKRSGLQSFRDFTVVYARIGDEYEVRMLELGRQDESWAEVLDGLDADSTYVTENSYVIKADIEKSGASHDH